MLSDPFAVLPFDVAITAPVLAVPIDAWPAPCLACSLPVSSSGTHGERPHPASCRTSSGNSRRRFKESPRKRIAFICYIRLDIQAQEPYSPLLAARRELDRNEAQSVMSATRFSK